MSEIQDQVHLNHAKDNFRDNTSRPIDASMLHELFPNSTIVGTPQRSGIALIMYTPHGYYVNAAIKDPRYILNGQSFGGTQTEKMIEYSLLQPTGREPAAKEASELLKKQTLPTLGAELEGYVYDALTGKLIPAEKQIETAQSLREDPTDVCLSPQELAIVRAKKIIERAGIEEKRGNIVIESSTPLTLGGEHPGVSTGLISSDHPYIQAMCRIFEQSYFIPSVFLDNRVQQVLNSYAQSSGFKNIDLMLSDLGVARVWDIAASHVSLGVPGLHPSMEIGIAIANILASDLATVAEFLTQSSPLHAGEIVRVNENNRQFIVNDVRTLSRYFLRTAYITDPFIKGTNELCSRITKGVVEGIATTPDRAAFHNIGPDGVPFVSAHARTRLRGFGNLAIPTARVEFVGGSSTPSLYDVLARDAYLTILWTAALEAVSNGQSPQEYFLSRGFPSLARWEYQQELSIAYSLYGTSNQDVVNLIQENLFFLSYMRKQHPHLKNYVDYVAYRIQNMGKKAHVSTIDEYSFQPEGNIGHVIVAMKQDGWSDVEILHQLNRHQLIVAKKIIDHEGNYEMLLHNLIA